MPHTYLFLPLEKVIHGAGSLGQLSAEAERLGCWRALIVTGRTLATKTGLVERVTAILGPRHAGTYAGIQQHVPETGIREAAHLAGVLDADLLVSVGGGSPIDAAKAVAHILAADSGSYLPHIAIPTTLSAAEFSQVAGYTVESSRSKARYADLGMMPRVVILDPEMTTATPARLWSSTGIRALDHAIETLYSPGEHPINDVLALEAICDLFAWLPQCQANPDGLEARQRCQLAAWMSFFGSGHIRYGLSHTLSKAFGARFGVPHGITSCITLPHVMRHKAPAEAARLAPIARRLALAGDDTPDEEAALAAANAVAGLIQELGLPSRLRDVGVPQEAFASIAQTAVGDSPQAAEVIDLLHRMW